MRIKHKYLRNRFEKNKAWHKAKNMLGGEFTYKASFPYYWFGGTKWDAEKQLKEHQKEIGVTTRRLLNGGKPWYNSPKWFRRPYVRKERRTINTIVRRMMKGELDLEIPVFSHNADWDWT